MLGIGAMRCHPPQQDPEQRSPGTQSPGLEALDGASLAISFQVILSKQGNVQFLFLASWGVAASDLHPTLGYLKITWARRGC